jgi:hypothetical protein
MRDRRTSLGVGSEAVDLKLFAERAAAAIEPPTEHSEIRAILVQALPYHRETAGGVM